MFITKVMGKYIKTTIASDAKQVDECIQELMSNAYNKKKVIGLDIIPCRNYSKEASVALLQLCDEVQCLIFRFTPNCTVPESLYNFLSLPAYTFVGFAIKDALALLRQDYGFVCKNSLEAINSKTLESHSGICLMSVMYTPPPNRISDISDYKNSLPEDLINLAVSNAFAAFSLGDDVLKSR